LSGVCWMGRESKTKRCWSKASWDGNW